MEIERLLKLHSHASNKDVLLMIISNRITHYLGDKSGAAVAIENFDVLVEDVLVFIESRKNSSHK